MPMLRFTAGALAPALVSLLVAAAPAPAAADDFGARARAIPARTACDADGRCYETGDPGYHDDRLPSRRRYDPDDNERPAPPPRRRYDPDDDRPPPPPPRRRFDPDDDGPPPPPPRHHFDPDDD